MEKENAFSSGEVGLPYIIQTARKYKMNDLIAQFITRIKHPSYYAFVVDGMRNFTCSYQSVRGEIKVNVKERKDEIILAVQLPRDVEYKIDTSNLKLRKDKIDVLVSKN